MANNASKSRSKMASLFTDSSLLISLLAAISRSLLTLMIFLASVNSLAFEKDECDYSKLKGKPYTTEQLLTKSVERNCPDLMDAILKNEKDADIFMATGTFTENIDSHLSLAIQTLKGLQEDDSETADTMSKFKILGQFGNYLKEKCPTENNQSSACLAKANFKTSMAKLQKKFELASAEEDTEEKENSRRNSPEGLIEQACACDKFIDLNQKAIDRQNEIGKISGTVNKAILNSAGSQIVDLRRIKSEVATDYKMKTKKELKNYKCHDVKNLANPLLRGTGINWP